MAIPQRYKDMGFTKVGQKKKSTRDGKKWMVLAKKGEQYKVVHGGDSSMQDYSQHKDEKRRDAFWNRMGKTDDVFSPRYWHQKFKTWEQGGFVGQYQAGGEISRNLHTIITEQGAKISLQDFEKLTLQQQKELAQPYLDEYARRGEEQLRNYIGQGYELVEEYQNPIQTNYVTENINIENSKPVKYITRGNKGTSKTKNTAAKIPLKDIINKTYTRTTVPLSTDNPNYQDGGTVSNNPILSQFLKSIGGDKNTRSQGDQVINQLENHLEAQRNNPLAPVPTVKVEDKRKVRATTGKPINPNKDLLTGKYSKEYIDRIIDAAIDLQVDPNIALAVALQESKFGQTTPGNVGHLIGDQGIEGVDGQDDVYDFIKVLKYKMEDYADSLKIPKDNKEARIQAYNGYGKLKPSTEKDYHGFKAKSFYGVEIPKEGLDMSKNPLYGKQIEDIRKNIIEKNEYMQRRIDGDYQDGNEYQDGGYVNTTGYTKGTPTENNPYNIIPSNSITMKDVDYPIMAYPNNDNPILMKPGKNYNFKNSESVLEIPILQMGDYLNPVYPDIRNREAKVFNKTINTLSKLVDSSIKDVRESATVISTITEGLAAGIPFSELEEGMKNQYGLTLPKNISKKIIGEYSKGQNDLQALHLETLMQNIDGTSRKDTTINGVTKGMLKSNRTGNVLQTYKSGGDVHNKKYQTGGPVIGGSIIDNYRANTKAKEIVYRDLPSLIQQFGNTGLNISGSQGTDMSSNFNNLLLAMAMSPMNQQKPNNVDLNDPIYQMQLGGTINFPDANVLQDMVNKYKSNTTPQANQFPSLANGLFGLNPTPQVSAPQLIPLEKKASGFWGNLTNALSFGGKNRGVDKVNSMITQQNDKIIAAAPKQTDQSNLNLLTQLPQIMSLFSSLANLEKGGMLQADSGVNLEPYIPIQAEKHKGVSEIIQNSEGLSNVKAKTSHDKMSKGDVTDIGSEGDYIYSAHPSTKEDWSKIPLYVDNGGDYREGEQTDLPSLVTVGGLLSVKKAVPAKIADIVSKKYPYRELKEGDPNRTDPYLNRAYEENASARDGILARVKQTAEERKIRDEERKTGIKKYPIGGYVQAAGAVTEVAGNVINMINTRKSLKDQINYLKGDFTRNTDAAFNNNKRALGSSATQDQLTALSMDTDVNRAQVDRSFLERYNPEVSNNLQNNALRSSFSDVLSSLRNNPNIDKVTKSNAFAQMTDQYYGGTATNALNYSNDLRGIETMRQGLNQQELNNQFTELETERGLNNQQRATIGSLGSDNIRNQANVDFEKYKTDDAIRQAILQAEATRRAAIGQGIANIGASLTKAGSLFPSKGGSTPSASPSTFEVGAQSIRDYKIPRPNIDMSVFGNRLDPVQQVLTPESIIDILSRVRR